MAGQYGKCIDKRRFLVNGDRVEVKLYFDGRRFAMQAGDTWFTDKDIDKVVNQVQEKLEADAKVELKPYINVRLGTWHGDHNHASGSGFGREHDPVIGFTVTWEVILLADDVEVVDRYRESRKGAAAKLVDGKVVQDGPIKLQWSGRDGWNAIPYSPKAVAALEAISQGIVTLHDKLKDLLEEGDVGKKLESMKQLPQLGGK